MSRAPLKGCSGATQACAGSAPLTRRRSRSSRRALSSPAASPASASRWRARAAGSVLRPSSVRLGSAELAGGAGRSRTGPLPSAGSRIAPALACCAGRRTARPAAGIAGEARGTDQDVRRVADALPRRVRQVPEHETFAGARDRLRGAVRFGQIGGEALAGSGEGGILGPAQGAEGLGGYEAEDAQQNGWLRGAEQTPPLVSRVAMGRVTKLGASGPSSSASRSVVPVARAGCARAIRKRIGPSPASTRCQEKGARTGPSSVEAMRRAGSRRPAGSPMPRRTTPSESVTKPAGNESAAAPAAGAATDVSRMGGRAGCSFVLSWTISGQSLPVG